MAKQSKAALITLLLIIFLDMIGVGIVYPLLPIIFLETGILGPISETLISAILGLLIASYPIAQFIGAPILGALSDKYGRKIVLLISLTGSAIGYAMFAIGIIIGNVYLLFASRLLDGFTGGNISVVRSAIADISDEKTKTKNFGLIGMMFGLGFILGPFIGGKLTDSSFVSWFNTTTPFWTAAILVSLNVIFLLIFFKETLTKRVQRKITALTGLIDIKKGLANKTLRPLYLTVFFAFFGWSFFTMYSQVFLYEKFAMDAAEIGMFFAYVGIWIAIAQGLIIRPVSNKYKPKKIIPIAMTVTACALVIYVIPTQEFWLYVIVPFLAVFFGFINPNLSTLLSNAVSKQEQGEVLGIQQSMLSLANIFPALLGGISLAVHVNLPIILAAITILATCIYFVRTFKEKHVDHTFY